MVSKWGITYSYKWGRLGLKPTDPNFLGHPSRVKVCVEEVFEEML